MVAAGINVDNNLVEILELTNHPWYIGVQFHPEFQSKPRCPHPLFFAFVASILRAQKEKR